MGSDTFADVAPNHCTEHITIKAKKGPSDQEPKTKRARRASDAAATFAAVEKHLAGTLWSREA